MIELKKNIESHYVTSYGAEVGEVICYIFERTLQSDPLRDFIFSTRDYSYFFKQTNEIDKSYLSKISFSNIKDIIISAIIKETKYNDHFMSWERGREYLDIFLEDLKDFEEVYTNSYWEKSDNQNGNISEFDMTGWTGISLNYWYDYGFIVITPTKIGVLWFGEDS